ncbi:MAG: tetratricopeptide repeat protein [Nitrosomonas sp.]|uniref:tetratricopeptide repeat protein n=1 Tax=Nitrosomonas sp. TaxID=42353 RepID=UPI0032EC787F
MTQLKKQQYNLSLSSFTTALSFAQNSGIRSIEALLLNYIGATYEMLGEIESARNYYTQLLKIRQEVHDQKGEAKTLANLASTYRSQGQ